MKQWLFVFAVVLAFSGVLMLVQPTQKPAKFALNDIRNTIPISASTSIASSMHKLAPASGTEISVISGIIGYRERVSLAAGSDLHVRLLSTKISSPKGIGGVIAQQIIEDVSAPAAFHLEYNKAALKNNFGYVLEAAIVNQQGEIIFHSIESISMNPDGSMQDSIAITVNKVD